MTDAEQVGRCGKRPAGAPQFFRLHAREELAARLTRLPLRFVIEALEADLHSTQIAVKGGAGKQVAVARRVHVEVGDGARVNLLLVRQVDVEGALPDLIYRKAAVRARRQPVLLLQRQRGAGVFGAKAAAPGCCAKTQRPFRRHWPDNTPES